MQPLNTAIALIILSFICSMDSAIGDVDAKPVLRFDHISKDDALLDPISIGIAKELPNWTLQHPGLLGPGASKFDAMRRATVVVKVDGGHGSGACISNTGLILTNYHVISGVAQTNSITGKPPMVEIIRCKTVGEKVIRDERTFVGTVVAGNPVVDLALIQISDLPDDWTYFKVAESATVGADCYVVGSQGSGMAWAIRSGIISGLYDYPLGTTDEVVSTATSVHSSRTQAEIFSTDCAISPGDSGGPLVDEAGDLIGITFATPRNLSGGAIGYHLSLGEVRTYIQKNKEPSPIPFDLWTAGNSHNAFTRVAEAIDLDSDGFVEGVIYVSYLEREDDFAPYAVFALVDTTDTKNRKPTTVEGNEDKLMPSKLWGLATTNGFKGDVFLCMRSDGLAATGHANAAGPTEIRLEIPEKSAPDREWRRSGKSWRFYLTSGIDQMPRFPFDSLSQDRASILAAVAEQLSN